MSKRQEAGLCRMGGKNTNLPGVMLKRGIGSFEISSKKKCFLKILLTEYLKHLVDSFNWPQMLNTNFSLKISLFDSKII